MSRPNPHTASHTAPRVLIVEDEPAIATVARDYLAAAGMVAHMRDRGDGAATAIVAGGYDLAILDVMLPGTDGLAICRELRATSDVPIIMTTARTEEIDRLLGLELGADDYLCKPYSPRELVARAKAVLRRRPVADDASEPSPADGAATAGSVREVEPRLLVDAERWRAAIDGTALDLTRREFALLSALAGRPGRVFSRDQLIAAAFPDDTDVLDRTVDSHVRNIRRKIGRVADFDPIRSVYGVGYAYEDRSCED